MLENFCPIVLIADASIEQDLENLISDAGKHTSHIVTYSQNVILKKVNLSKKVNLHVLPSRMFSIEF